MENNFEELREFYMMVAEEAFRECVDRTPVDTGKLVNSYYIQSCGTKPNDICLVNDCEYSVYVHEMIDNRHPNGGQAKFMEDAGVEIEQDYNVKVTLEILEDKLVMYFDNEEFGYSVTGRKKEQDRLIKEFSKIFQGVNRSEENEKISKEVQTRNYDYLTRSFDSESNINFGVDRINLNVNVKSFLKDLLRKLTY